MAEFEDQVYDIINSFQDHQVDVPTLIATVLSQHSAQHRGEVRRALRMLTDADRIVYLPNDIVKIN